jgi:F-type H+-transporting ATPase subunit delta
MQGSSRGSFAAASERLDTEAAAATGEVLRELAGDLQSFSELLGREVTLRRALSDPGTQPEARQKLLNGLLTGKVSGAALNVLAVLVKGRWSTGADLADAAELLAVGALLVEAERSGELEEVEDELFRFSRVVSGSPELAAILSNRVTAATRRTALVGELLGHKARAATVRLAELAAVAGIGGRRFDASLERLVTLAATRRDREVAYVTSAAPLNDEQESRLSSRLAELYHRQISLKVEVDPLMLGGVTVRVGDDLYDGSVSQRLANARTSLSK